MHEPAAIGVSTTMSSSSVPARVLASSIALVLAAGIVIACDGPTKPAPSTFREIVDQKAQTRPGHDVKLFLENAKRFYARYYVPPGGLTLPEHLGSAAEGFVTELVERAQSSASERGERLVRARDVEQALQSVLPHTVDDLEEVTFFPRLDAEDRVVLDAFDLESFRDFGMQWRLLEVMLDMRHVELAVEPDPLAAEVVAEALARYSVLLFRVAGNLARSEERVPFVRGTHLARAAAEIRQLAKQHHETAATVPSSDGSAPASATFMSEATAEFGIDFRHRSSDWLNRLRRSTLVVPPTFSGGGLAAGDVNGDGHDDLLFTSGIGNVLYLHDGEGGWVRAPDDPVLTAPGRDGRPGEARHPIFADFDNDGDQDVLITYVNAPHRLLRNEGAGRLVDASADAGLGGEDGVAGPATVFDFDRDGRLDVYVCYFGNYLRGHVHARVANGAGGSDPEDFPGDLPTLARNNENGMPNRLFRNRGGLRFEEVEDSGAADPRWCQAVTHTDFDGDGWQDLVVANDFGRNTLLRNLGAEGTPGRFADVSERLGITRSDHSMNVGIADLNADHFPDIYVSNINMITKDSRYVLPDENMKVKRRRKHMAGLHVVESSMLYVSIASDAGLGRYESSNAAERSNDVGWAWDAEFFDFDNDGDDDLYVANGSNEYFNHLAHHQVGGDTVFDWNREPNVFYRNEDGMLRNVSGQSGADHAGNSRAAVYVDPDGDGDLDIAINDFHGPAVFFRNDLSGADTHFVKLRLEGDPERGSNRDAIGARILLRTRDGKQVWREIHGGSGYLSTEPKEQHAGLGASQTVDVTIRWPGGGVQEIRGLRADRTWAIRENENPRSLTDRDPWPEG